MDKIISTIYNLAYVANMKVYIATSGYRLPSGLIVKEICCLFPNDEYNHYILKPPTNWDLSDVDKRTIRYAIKNLNSLSYHDGDIPYENIETIFTRYQEYQVYTYSRVTFKLLQNILPTTIIVNVQSLGYQMPSELPNPMCCRAHNTRYCAKAKSIAIKTFMES